MASELEQALNDTIETITGSCVVRIAHYTLHTEVLESAKETWKERYREPFEKAIAQGRTWKGDKSRVLDRARQVGYLAAFFAGIRAIAEELVRAGVVGPKQPSTPGQDIFLQPAAVPVVDSWIAAAAAGRIDCVMPKEALIEWIWCPPPSLSPRDMLVAIAPRELFTPGEPSRELVEQMFNRLTGRAC